MKEKFWSIVNLSQPGAPFGLRMVMFDSRNSAVDEMLRLQKRFPRNEFCVMESVAAAREVAAGVFIEDPITDNG
jgi:hypothetical protein